MPFELLLSTRLKADGWKVKIFEKERLEPPHLTILRGPRKWRVGLRDGALLVPPGGRRGEIPQELWDIVTARWVDLCDQWDLKYPENPVEGGEHE